MCKQLIGSFVVTLKNPFNLTEEEESAITYKDIKQNKRIVFHNFKISKL